MPRTGRPRGFDKTEVIDRAMLLFWQQGYEATSLSQLKAAMGDLSSASFYAAFQSKEQLFRAVLQRYLDTHGRVLAPLSDPSLAPRDAIERALRGSARMQTDTAHPLGCLVILSTATCSPENRHLQMLLAQERGRNRAMLRGCVERAVSNGALPRDTDAGALVTLFDTFLVGLAIAARDGVPFASFDAAISGLMGIWDTLAALQNAPPPSTDQPDR
jgi:TetR/AcrR family transcriptional repressor for divergent bdcA